MLRKANRTLFENYIYNEPLEFVITARDPLGKEASANLIIEVQES